MDAETRRSLPWWLDGDQACEFCLQLYAVDLSVHCVVCDAPVCPHCVIEVREQRLVQCYCPACFTEREQ